MNRRPFLTAAVAADFDWRGNARTAIGVDRGGLRTAMAEGLPERIAVIGAPLAASEKDF
jgi:hypothetical protein